MELKKMKKISQTTGLNFSQLMEVVGKLESKKIAVREKHGWMQCLIPKESVPETVFLRLSCLLSDKHFPPQIKLEIIKWIIVAFPLMKRSTIYGMFRSLYEMYFQLLNDKAMRPYICQFLYIITIELDVTKRRVNYLQQKLIGRDREERFLVLLLVKYYNLRPSLFETKLEAELQVEFESHNYFTRVLKTIHPNYKPKYTTVCASTMNKRNYNAVSGASFVSVESDFSLLARHAPTESHSTSQSRHARTESHSTSQKECTFIEIAREFEVLKKSSATQILQSKYRRLLLTNGEYVVTMKVFDYIVTKLKRKDFTPEFLQDIIKLFHELQRTWRGVTNFVLNPETELDDRTLDFCVALLPFEELDLSDDLLNKMNIIEDELLKSNPIKVLNCFSRLYETWVFRYYNNYEANSSCKLRSDKRSINGLSVHIKSICTKLLSVDIKPFWLNQILLDYERVSLSHMKVKDLILNLPDSSVIMAAFFSLSYFTLDNLGKVLLRYQDEVKHMESQNNPQASSVLEKLKLLLCDANILINRQKYQTCTNTYLSKRSAMIKLKTLLPHFNNHLLLSKHPALILKRQDYLQNEMDYDDYGDYLEKNGLEYLVTLLGKL